MPRVRPGRGAGAAAAAVGSIPSSQKKSKTAAAAIEAAAEAAAQAAAAQAAASAQAVPSTSASSSSSSVGAPTMRTVQTVTEQGDLATVRFGTPGVPPGITKPFNLRTNSSNPNIKDKMIGELQSGSITLDRLSDYSIYGEIDIDTPAYLIADVCGFAFSRYQKYTNDKRPAETFGWERTAQTVNDPDAFFHHTFFPAIASKTTYTVDSGANVLTSGMLYAVCYSSHKPNSVLLPRTGQFVKKVTQPPYSHELWVHNGCIGDDSCDVSVQSALECFAPRQGSYVWIVPMNDQIRMSDNPERYEINGPSAGLAVAACLLGLPEIIYTGFTRQILPDRKLVPSGGLDSVMVKEMPRAVNFVESVSLIDFKVLLAMASGLPIVVPTSANMDSVAGIRTKIQDFVNRNYLTHVAKSIYTASQIEDGVPFAEFKTPIYMAETVSDVVAVAAVAAAAWLVDVDVPTHISANYSNAVESWSIFRRPDTSGLMSSDVQYIEAARAKRKEGARKSKQTRAANKKLGKKGRREKQIEEMRKQLADREDALRQQMERRVASIGAQKPEPTLRRAFDMGDLDERIKTQKGELLLAPLKKTEYGRPHARLAKEVARTAAIPTANLTQEQQERIAQRSARLNKRLTELQQEFVDSGRQPRTFADEDGAAAGVPVTDE